MAVIYHQVVALGAHPQKSGAGQLFGQGQGFGQELVGNLGAGRIVLPGDKEAMPRREGIDIHHDQEIFILINSYGGNPTFDNIAEDALAHPDSSRRQPFMVRRS